MSDVRTELGRERVGWRASAKRRLWTGIAVASLGAVLSLVTYLTADERGGRFYVFTGLIGIGVIWTWRAYVRLKDIAEVEAIDQDSAKPSG